LVAYIAHSTRADGDLSPSGVPAPELAARRLQAVPHQWCALRQVHSDRVIVVSASGGDSRPAGDALVTTEPGVALAVHSGDCVPVGFVSDAGVVASAHAGWKGLEAGVIASELHRLGVNVDAWSPDCTATDGDRYWSHRARQESGRIALVTWLETARKREDAKAS